MNLAHISPNYCGCIHPTAVSLSNLFLKVIGTGVADSWSDSWLQATLMKWCLCDSWAVGRWSEHDTCFPTAGWWLWAQTQDGSLCQPLWGGRHLPSWQLFLRSPPALFRGSQPCRCHNCGLPASWRPAWAYFDALRQKKNKSVSITKRMPSCCLILLLTHTLWCAKQDVDGAGAVHLVLLGNDDGKRSAGSAHIL